jgi:hypothetical protein
MDGILCQSKSYCGLKICFFFSDFSVQGSERLSFHQCCVFQEHNSVLNMCVANIICFFKNRVRSTESIFIAGLLEEWGGWCYCFITNDDAVCCTTVH